MLVYTVQLLILAYFRLLDTSLSILIIYTNIIYMCIPALYSRTGLYSQSLYPSLHSQVTILQFMHSNVIMVR